MKVGIKFHILFLAVIIIWTTLVYWNSLNNSFHFDDTAITDDVNVRSFDGVWNIGMRKVVFITFYLNYLLDGFNVTYYHVVNIVLHIINAILIYFLVLVTLQRVGKGSKYVLLFAPLLFALHPLNTEPVNYIVQRTIIMCTAFYILSILLFALAFPLPGNKVNITKTLMCLTGSLLSLVLCAFSKEVAITLPFMLLCYYLYFIVSDMKGIMKYLPISLISLIIAVAVAFAVDIGIFRAISQQISKIDPLKHIFINLIAQINVAVKYLTTAVLPLPSLLNIDHDVRWTDDFFNIQTVLSVFILLLLLFIILWTLRNNRLLSFALLWMFLAHSPTSIIPRNEIMVEYRNYLPLFGFTLLISVCLENVILMAKNIKAIPYVATLIICILFSIAVVERNKVWRDDETLWKDAVSKSPNKARPHSALSNHYVKVGKMDEAIIEAKKAIDLDKSWLLPYVRLGMAYSEKGNREEAIGWFNKVILLYNDKSALGELLPPLYNELGLVPAIPSRFLVEAYNNLGILYKEMGRYKEAEDNLKEAIRITPTYGAAYINLGGVYAKIGKKEEAMKCGEKALQYDSDAWEPYCFMALMYLDKGDRVKAGEYYATGRKFMKGTDTEKKFERLILKELEGKN